MEEVNEAIVHGEIDGLTAQPVPTVEAGGVTSAKLKAIACGSASRFAGITFEVKSTFSPGTASEAASTRAPPAPKSASANDPLRALEAPFVMEKVPE